jgi:hypothetical protein
MGQLYIHQKDGILELHGFSLRAGDHVEVFLIDAWVPGCVAHDQRGWYLLTSNHMGIRLRTGLTARLLLLSREQSFLDQEETLERERTPALVKN